MKGFIYVIRSKQTTDVYYGSTKQILDMRLSDHQSNYRRYLIGKYHYVTSYEIIQHDDAIIELVETIDYEDKKELHKRERYYIQNHECVNKQIPGRTVKEHYEDNKEHKLEKLKEYYKKNRDKISEQKRIAYLKKKEDLL
jgi:hypothetical protein